MLPCTNWRGGEGPEESRFLATARAREFFVHLPLRNCYAEFAAGESDRHGKSLKLVRVRHEKRAARYDVKVGPVTFKASRIDRPPEPRDAGAGVGGDVANGTLPRSRSGRRLRNWIILANVAAWILIALVIRAIFF